MKTYRFSILLDVEVEAFTEEDAKEAIRDCLGEGETLGLNVIDFEVVDNEV
jgi:hypothetical protein